MFSRPRCNGKAVVFPHVIVVRRWMKNRRPRRLFYIGYMVIERRMMWKVFFSFVFVSQTMWWSLYRYVVENKTTASSSEIRKPHAHTINSDYINIRSVVFFLRRIRSYFVPSTNISRRPRRNPDRREFTASSRPYVYTRPPDYGRSFPPNSLPSLSPQRSDVRGVNNLRIRIWRGLTLFS